MKPRLLVVGEERAVVQAAAARFGLEVVRRGGDVVLCHGGDGTLLRAERWHPGLPKLTVRPARSTRPCAEHELSAVLGALVAGSLVEERLQRLELGLGASRGFALNDVVLRNDNPALAVRFRLAVDGGPPEESVGDGLVAATPFGSTGYFHSITRQRFDAGLGLAFNNCTVVRPPRILAEGSRVEVEVVRGPAALVHDNDPRSVVLREGGSFCLALAAEPARVFGLDALRCQRCRRLDSEGFLPH